MQNCCESCYASRNFQQNSNFYRSNHGLETSCQPNFLSSWSNSQAINSGSAQSQNPTGSAWWNQANAYSNQNFPETASKTRSGSNFFSGAYSNFFSNSQNSQNSAYAAYKTHQHYQQVIQLQEENIFHVVITALLQENFLGLLLFFSLPYMIQKLLKNPDQFKNLSYKLVLNLTDLVILILLLTAYSSCIYSLCMYSVFTLAKFLIKSNLVEKLKNSSKINHVYRVLYVVAIVICVYDLSGKEVYFPCNFNTGGGFDGDMLKFWLIFVEN